MIGLVGENHSFEFHQLYELFVVDLSVAVDVCGFDELLHFLFGHAFSQFFEAFLEFLFGDLSVAVAVEEFEELLEFFLLIVLFCELAVWGWGYVSKKARNSLSSMEPLPSVSICLMMASISCSEGLKENSFMIFLSSYVGGKVPRA
jgi:hypothetical protein